MRGSVSRLGRLRRKYASDRLHRMRKKKPTKKKLGKKKSASRKKMVRKRKPLQPMKAKHSKGPSGGSSEQIHQDVGIATAEAEVPANDVPENDGTPGFGGEE